MATLTEIDALTRRYFIPVLVDNAFNSNVLLMYLARKAKKADGGTELVLPVILQTPGLAVSYTGADVLPLQFVNTNYAAEFPWANYAELIPITGEDDYKNQGDSAVINLIQAKIQESDLDLRQTIGSDLQLTGTGNNSKAIIGLGAAVDDGTNVVTYGNISRTTFPNWKANYSANSGVGRALTLSLMNTQMENASKDNDKPNLIITTHGLHAKFISLQQPNIRYENADLANMGFKNVAYQGRLVVVDENVQTSPVHKMWLLNTNYMDLWTQRSRFFRYVPFQQLPTQDAAVAKILVTLQLVCTSPRLQVQITDLDPTL